MRHVRRLRGGMQRGRGLTLNWGSYSKYIWSRPGGSFNTTVLNSGKHVEGCTTLGHLNRAPASFRRLQRGVTSSHHITSYGT